MKSNTLKTLLWAIYLIFSLIVISTLFANSKIYWGLFTIVLALASSYIFYSRKTYALRFMYPGLITFLFLMIFPILFTIYIGLTNIGTGHFFSKDEVKNIILSETYIENDAKEFVYQIAKEKGSFIISVPTEQVSAIFSLKEKNVHLANTYINIKDNKLPPKEVLNLSKRLKEINFIFNNQKLKYFRINQLIELKNLYSINENTIRDNLTGVIYKDNTKTGFFESGTNNLYPGYYVHVGLDNLTNLLKDNRIKSSFIKTIVWTFTWAFCSVALTFIVGIFLAIFLNDKGLRLKALYRGLLIIPYSIPFFISILIFKGMLNKDFGIINSVLSNFGISNIPWLETGFFAKISCLMVNLWLGFPYMFLVTTGILQSIPESIYEASTLDGAGKWQTFKCITLPLVMSSVAPLLVGSFAFNLNNFVGIYLLTGGGPEIPGSTTPLGETDILISYTYRLAFEGGAGQNFGLASSVAILIFIIITILTLINYKLSGMMDNNE